MQRGGNERYFATVNGTAGMYSTTASFGPLCSASTACIRSVCPTHIPINDTHTRMLKKGRTEHLVTRCDARNAHERAGVETQVRVRCGAEYLRFRRNRAREVGGVERGLPGGEVERDLAVYHAHVSKHRT